MILINDEIRIVKKDDYNYAIEVLKEINNKNGKYFKWVLTGYYSTIKNALKEVIEIMISKSIVSDTLDARELINKIDELENTLNIKIEHDRA